MKLTIIGGGSVRTPRLIPSLVGRAVRLGLQELWLMDSDPERLELIGGMCRRQVEQLDGRFRVFTSGDARVAITDASHVITSIRPGHGPCSFCCAGPLRPARLQVVHPRRWRPAACVATAGSGAAEARRLTGRTDVDGAARDLRRFVPTLVIKEGEGGARCWQGGHCYHAPALPVTVTDTTGAGDVFNAAFIAAHLAGADPRVCLQHGTVAGSLSTQMAGGANSAPDPEALQSALDLHTELFAGSPGKANPQKTDEFVDRP